MLFKLTQKDLLELAFWHTCNLKEEQDKLPQYLSIWGNPHSYFKHSKQCSSENGGEICTCHIASKSVLDIGCGPKWGFLKSLTATHRVAVDPLLDVYHASGLTDDRQDIFAVSQSFEHWDTDRTFDAIFTANALDHGEMGFYLLPKMWRMLKPAGRIYLHVHLRSHDMLNLVHDHSLTEEQFDKHLSYTNLVQVERKIFENDIDGNFCKALVCILEKP